MAGTPVLVVVEDDVIIGTDIVQTLRGFDYEVVGPLSSGEALLAHAESSKFDFVLMDINLAGELDGIQTAQKLQASGGQNSEAAIVFLSALTDEETLQRVKLVRPFGYLMKPFDGNELRAGVELALLRMPGAEEEEDEEFESVPLADLDDTTPTGRFIEVFQTVSVLQGLSDNLLTALAQDTILKEVPAGEHVISEGESAAGVFVPVSGRLCATKTSESGKELIVSLLAPGDSFGLFYGLKSFSRSATTKARTDSRILWIPMRIWRTLLTDAPLINENLAEELAQRLSFAHVLASDLAHSRVEGRIVHMLLALAPRFGRKVHNAQSTRIFITRKELAELTGTTPESAIRCTKKLERDGLLDLSRPGIVKLLDLEALKQRLLETSV